MKPCLAEKNEQIKYNSWALKFRVKIKYSFKNLNFPLITFTRTKFNEIKMFPTV